MHRVRKKQTPGTLSHWIRECPAFEESRKGKEHIMEWAKHQPPITQMCGIALAGQHLETLQQYQEIPSSIAITASQLSKKSHEDSTYEDLTHGNDTQEQRKAEWIDVPRFVWEPSKKQRAQVLGKKAEAWMRREGWTLAGPNHKRHKSSSTVVIKRNHLGGGAPKNNPQK